MTPGYLSREAVNDLLAIKEGEKDFLKTQNQELRLEIVELKKKLATLQPVAL